MFIPIDKLIRKLELEFAIMNKYQPFDRLYEGVQVIDKDMRYLYVNQAVADQCMQSIDDLIGNRMIDKFPSLKGSEVYARIQECMNTGSPTEMLNQFEQLDGSKGWFELRMEAVDDGVIIFSFDVTRQKQLEEKVSKMNFEIETLVEERTKELMDDLKKEMDLNSFKAKFVSMASHQFRTPLTSIILSTDLVESYGNDLVEKEKITKHFDRIKSSANHMVSVLNDFLSFDELSSGKKRYWPTRTDLVTFIGDIKETLNPILKDNQQIITEIYQTSKEVFIDQQIIKAVMLNLLSNAIKYSPEESRIRLKMQQKNNHFCFEVCDNGIGIPKKEQDMLFNSFFRASNAQNIQGSGLGLNIVKQYVDLANGSIEFDSTEGKGTRFIVEIPELHPVTKMG